MPSFALITEGITDQVAISSILIGYYNDEPDIREIQPVRDATDEEKQGNMAGWEKVVEYCTLEDFRNVFSTNDYVIIQIDTDVCGHPNFPVSISDASGERPVADIIDDTRKFLFSKIDDEVVNRFAERILFAISVHSLECWILPLYAKNKSGARRTKSCEKHLTRELGRHNIKFEKTFRAFLDLTKPFLRKPNLLSAAKNNDSLAIFLQSLPTEELEDERMIWPLE